MPHFDKQNGAQSSAIIVLKKPNNHLLYSTEPTGLKTTLGHCATIPSDINPNRKNLCSRLLPYTWCHNSCSSLSSRQQIMPHFDKQSGAQGSALVHPKPPFNPPSLQGPEIVLEMGRAINRKYRSVDMCQG